MPAMRVLLLNQAFYPDVVASGQHLTDLALELTGQGHAVTVLTAARGYDDPDRRFPASEVWKGIQIIRVWSPRFSKRFRWSRTLDFAGHMAAFALRMLVLSRYDVIVAMTSPPLVSVLAAVMAKLRGARVALWIMDLNPDEAVAAGWLQPGAITTRSLDWLLSYSLSRADLIIALDRFMKSRILGKGVDESHVVVLPLWAHAHDATFSEATRRSFRHEHGLDDQFVVMYAGNHSPCHPLDTLLEAARQLRDESRLCFCFVGGGSGATAVHDFAVTHQLKNIRRLPYQPREQLGGTLSAADLHVVAMGDAFVGIVHPCKIYNILRVGSPILYIGPTQSHIVDIGAGVPVGHLRAVRHGDVEAVKDVILSARRAWELCAEPQRRSCGEQYASTALLPQLAAQITSLGTTTEAPLRRLA